MGDRGRRGEGRGERGERKGRSYKRWVEGRERAGNYIEDGWNEGKEEEYIDVSKEVKEEAIEDGSKGGKEEEGTKL